jgi:hypothetical protein
MGFLNPKSKEEKNKNWEQEQILIRGAWPPRASFLILTSVYEEQEARNRRKWMRRPAAPRTRDPRRTGSLATRNLAWESASCSLAQEGGVAAAQWKGTGTRKASKIDVESYAWFRSCMPGSAVPIGHRQNTTTTYTFGVGPPGLEGLVRRPSSNPPRAGSDDYPVLLDYTRLCFTYLELLS